jgi:ribonuclease P/MRP protein subunit POP3
MDDAPGTKALVEYVREHVGVTECPWIDEAMRPEWKGTKVVDVAKR